MRVLVITNYLGNFGGLGRYSYEVVKALRAQSTEVDVLSEAPQPKEKFEYNQLRPVFGQKKTTLMKNLLHNLATTRRIAKDYDVIHAHDGWPYGVYGWYATLGTKKRLFVTGIGTYSVAPLKEKVRGVLLRLAYKRAAGIFCISEYVLKRLRETGPYTRARVVFMGTTELPKVPADRIAELSKKFSVGEKYPIIVSVGDVKHRKGQLDTLKSLHLLKDAYPHFLYVIIGDDSDVYYVGRIKSYIKEFHLEDNVLIISKMYDDKILSFFYTICDLVMLNSNNEQDHFEGFGLVLLEAAQFGKPTIGSRGCGIESAISDGYNGYLANQGDHDDIAAKVRRIVEKDAAAFGPHALEFYKRFLWEKTAREYLRDYGKSQWGVV